VVWCGVVWCGVVWCCVVLCCVVLCCLGCVWMRVCLPRRPAGVDGPRVLAWACANTGLPVSTALAAALVEPCVEACRTSGVKELTMLAYTAGTWGGSAPAAHALEADRLVR
jgi:hypothetical protein